MRRQSVILTAFFALFLATLAPIRAQESASTDANAGIMLTATSGIAFTSLEAYARDCWNKTTLFEGQDVTYYELGLVDLPDPGSYDCWLWAGGLIQQITTNGVVTSKGGALFQGVVIRLPNGNWTSSSGVLSVNIAQGNWPVYFRVSGSSFVGATFYASYTNTGNITVQDAANFMTNLRSFLVALKNLAITGDVVNDLDVVRLNDFETYDADGGGVIDLVEWVQGTSLNNCFDDKVSMNDVDCLCGACCSCECVCGKWGGAECGKTPDACDCHKLDETCTCGDYCCLHKCECGAHLPGEAHSAHKNGKPGCDETDGEDGCDCHETDDPENPDEEECTCANYCCYHTCECKRCADLPADKHSQHQNRSPTCDETNGEDGCDCHKTDDPENPDEEECTCAKYCCYHTCECKRCADLPAGSHSQHKNGSPTCTGTTGSGGCSCHTTTDDEEEEFDPPQQPDFEELTPEERKKFLSGSSESDPNSFSGALNRLRNALNQKFKIDVLASWFDPDFSGDLPRFDVPLPNEMGTIIIDFATLKTYIDMLMLRSVLAFGVFWYFISAVIRDVKKFL